MKVLVGIGGGIAAYKSPELIRLLQKKGADVKVVTTRNALEFVTPLTLETISQHKVYSDVFAPQNDHSTEHVSLPDWADVMVIAPATADVIAKMANGIADDALSTTYAALDKPVFVAPAMNVRMYQHPAFQRNLKQIIADGCQLIDAEEGYLACGTVGKGRMASIETIASAVIKGSSNPEVKSLAGQRVLVTAGPTHERLDPVRFIGNYSTGKMGFALAEECARQGAEVTLVAGPVQRQTIHPLIRRIDVVSAQEMHDAVMKAWPDMNGAILCAAVADFRPSQVADQKIKREGNTLHLDLQPTPDIAAAVGQAKRPGQWLVGFALETHDELLHAQEKMRRKNLDLIVLNSLQDAGAGFGYDTNKVTLLHRDGRQTDLPLMSKMEVAQKIIEELALKC